MTGDLGQQGTADALDAEGEAGMFNGAGMAQIAEHGQEAGSLFLIQPVQQVGDVGVGVAELRRSRHDLLRLRRMCYQSDSHQFFSFLRRYLHKGVQSWPWSSSRPTFSKLISTIWSPAAGLTFSTLPRPKTLCSTMSPGS